jgi:hypothetical protein
VALAALVGSAMVAAPAAADADGVSLECSWEGGPFTEYWWDATVTEAGSPYTGPATVEINADPDGANTWVSHDISVTAGHAEDEVASFFAGTDWAEVGIRVTAGTASDTCWASYDPVLVDYSGSLVINAGDTAAILADALVSPAVEDEPLHASLMVQQGSSWIEVADSTITSYGHYAVLSYRPTYSRTAYIVVYSGLDGRYLGSTDDFIINVKRSTPAVISKPSSLVQGKSGTITAAYGSATTVGKASLQVYTGGAWKTLTTKSFTGGVVSFTRSQTVTSKYRVAFTPTGKSTVYTAAFTMTYLPLFSMKDPGVVKRGDWVDIRVTNRWDASGTIKVQYYSGGSWHTYRTYKVTAKESFWMSIQVKATYKWRILAGSYASPSLTVRTK